MSRIRKQENIPRVESAHVVVAFHAAIHDGSIALKSDRLGSPFMIHIVREAPHALVNLSELHGSAGIVPDGVHEGLVEIAVIKENVRIVVPSVKMALNRPNRLNDAIQLLVPCEDNECTVHLLSLVWLWLQAS